MYEIQRRKGRLLTASSLALAVILTTGASSAWAQNTTATDGGTVSGGNSSTPLTIQGVTGSKASVTLTGTTEASVLGANGKADTIEVTAATPADKLTITGTGGNLVENTETKSAISLGIGASTTVEVAGKGGTLANVTGDGTGSSVFSIAGTLADNTTVNTGKVSGVSFRIDPAIVNSDSVDNAWVDVENLSILNVAKDVTGVVGKSNYLHAVYSIINVAGSVTNNSVWVHDESVVLIGNDNGNTWAPKVLNSLGITGGSTLNQIAQYSGTNWANADINHGLGANTQAISSILVLGTATTIGNGNNYNVDVTVPSSTTPSSQATFGEGSLLVVDAAAIGNKAALTDGNVNGEAIVNDKASLYIVNTQVGQTSILSGFDNGISNYNTATLTKTGLVAGDSVAGWNTNLRFDTRLFDASRATVGVNGTGTGVDLNTSNAYIGAGAAYADGRISSGTANMIDGMYYNRANDVDSANAGIKFVSRAVNENYLDTNQNNGKKVVTTIEGAAAMASTAGVQTSTYSISNTLTDNYNARLSYLRDTAPAAGSGEAGTIGIWVNPFYNSTDVDGVRIGRHSTEYEFNYGGGTIGLDSNISDNFRLGLAFSAGGGDTESKGSNFNKTESDFDFWGLGVYGSYTNGMFGLTGDISYSSTSYDIDQRIPGLSMNKLTADVDTDTFTVGLTGEYRFLTSNNLNIIPHLGLRYTNLKTDSYRVKEKGVGNVFNISSETQNIWTIPLGVTFTGEVATSSDWVIQPKADLGVIFAAGDLDADSKFRINGTNYGGRLTADDVVDAVTFNGLVGLKAENCDGFSVGLDYNFKASDNLTSHGVTGTIRYDF